MNYSLGPIRLRPIAGFLDVPALRSIFDARLEPPNRIPHGRPRPPPSSSASIFPILAFSVLMRFATSRSGTTDSHDCMSSTAAFAACTVPNNASASSTSSDILASVHIRWLRRALTSSTSSNRAETSGSSRFVMTVLVKWASSAHAFALDANRGIAEPSGLNSRSTRSGTSLTSRSDK